MAKPEKAGNRRSSRNRTQVSYLELDDVDNISPEIDVVKLRNLIMQGEFEPLGDAILPADLTMTELRRTGFRKPYLVAQGRDVEETRKALGIRLPPFELTTHTIAENVGYEYPVNIVDVATQGAGPKWTLGQWREYFYKPAKQRGRLLNVVSLELSGSKLAKMVAPPTVVCQLDLVNRVWPQDDPDKPQVLLYALMGVAGCVTDFHVDFGGSSVWYHMVSGKKVFLLVPPTDGNMELFENWSSGEEQLSVFYGNLAEGVMRVELQAGDTMLIPSGWPHAVATPVDSVVVGGNFLHGLDISHQLLVWKLEERLGIRQVFRFPLYKTTMWHTARHYLEEIKAGSRSGKGGLTLAPWEVAGLQQLVEILSQWQKRGNKQDIPPHPPGLLSELLQRLEDLKGQEQLEASEPAAAIGDAIGEKYTSRSQGAMEPSLPTRAEDKGHRKDGKVERNGNQAGCLNGSQVTGVQNCMSAWPSINSCRSGEVKAVHDENRRDGSVVNSMNKGSQLGTEWKVPKGSPPGSQKARELLKASVRRRHVAKEPTRAPQALPNAQLQTAIHSLVHQRPGPGADVPQGQSAEGVEAVRDYTEAGCAHRQLQETRRFADSDGRPEEEDTHREPQEGRKLGDAHKVPGNSQGRVGEERRPPQSGLGAPDRNGDKCSGCEMRRSTDTVGDPKDKSCPGCSVCPQEGEAQMGIASLGKRKWAAMLAVKKSLAVKQWPLQEVTLTAYQPPKQPCSVDASKSLDSVEEDRKRKLGHLKALLRGKTKLQASVQVGGVQLPDSGARLAAHIDELREGIKELGGDPDDIFDDAVTKKGFAPAQRNSNTHAITPLVVSSLPEPSPRNFDSRHADGQEPHSKPGDTDGKEAKAGAWGGKGWTFEDEEGRVQGPFTADQLKMLKDHDLVTDSTVCSHPLMGALALLKVLGGSLNDGNSCTPDCDQCSVAPAVSSAGSLSKDGPLDPKLSHEGAGEGESSSGSILNHRDGQGACPDSAPEGLIFYPCSQVQEIDPEGNVDVVTGNAGTPAPGECVGQSHSGGVGQLDRPDVDSQAEMLPAPPDHPTGFFPIAAGTQQDLQTCGNVGMPVCWDEQLVSSKQASAQQPFDTSLTCQRSLHRAEVQEALDCTAAQVDLGGDELVQDDRCRGVTSITGMSHQSCAVGSAHYASQIGQAASPAFSLQSAAGAAPGRVSLLRDSELNGSFANQGATLHLAASMNSPLSNGLVSGSFTGQGAALLACNQPIRMESGSSMNELEDAEIWQFVNHLGATEGPVSLRRLRCKFQSGLVSVNTICHDEDEGTSVTLGRLMAGLPDFVVQARLRKLRHSSQGMAANALPLAQPVGCMRHSPLSHPVPRTFEDSGASSKTLAVDSRLPMGLIYPEAPSSALQTGCYQLQTAPQAAQASRLFMQQQPMAAPVNGAGCTAGSKWPTGAFAAGGVAIQGHANPAFIPSPIAQAVEGGILQMRPNVPPPVGLQFAYQIPPSGTYFTRR